MVVKNHCPPRRPPAPAEAAKSPKRSRSSFHLLRFLQSRGLVIKVALDAGSKAYQPKLFPVRILGPARRDGFVKVGVSITHQRQVSKKMAAREDALAARLAQLNEIMKQRDLERRERQRWGEWNWSPLLNDDEDYEYRAILHQLDSRGPMQPVTLNRVCAVAFAQLVMRVPQKSQPTTSKRKGRARSNSFDRLQAKYREGFGGDVQHSIFFSVLRAMGFKLLPERLHGKVSLKRNGKRRVMTPYHAPAERGPKDWWFLDGNVDGSRFSDSQPQAPIPAAAPEDLDRVYIGKKPGLDGLASRRMPAQQQRALLGVSPAELALDFSEPS